MEIIRQYLSVVPIEIYVLIIVFETILLYIILFHKINSSCKKDKLTSENVIDFANIINSAFNVNELYHELITKCHPDRFATDKEKYAIASELSLLISQNRTNKKMLEIIKIRAINELNIKL